MRFQYMYYAVSAGLRVKINIILHNTTSKYKKLLISKRRIGILKKLPKQGKDSESL